MPVSIDRMPNKPHIQRGANGTAATVRPVQGAGPQGPPGPGNSNADVAGYVTGAGPTQTALQASLVPRWQPLTAYVTGDIRMAPDGSIVERTSDGTSGSTYSGTNWKTVTGLANTFGRLSGVQAVATANAALVPMRHNPVDATSGNRTMTLADATDAGQMVVVSKKDSSANTVTVSVAHLRDGGAGSITLVGQYEAITFTSKADGTWWPIGDHKTKAYLETMATGQAAVQQARTPLLGRKLRGGNIVVKPSQDWHGLFSEWDWDNWIKPQVDRAVALGMNAIRLMGGPRVIAVAPSGGTTLTQAQIDARWSQLALYCQIKGLVLYPCLCQINDFSAVSPGDYRGATLVNSIKTTAAVLASFPNVIAFDVFQEGDPLTGTTWQATTAYASGRVVNNGGKSYVATTGGTSASSGGPTGTGTGITDGTVVWNYNGIPLLASDVLYLMDQVRSVAPLPMSMSYPRSVWSDPTKFSIYDLVWSDAAGADFIDLHTAWSTSAGAANPSRTDIDAYGTRYNKPVLFGEYGAAQDHADPASVYRAARDIHNRPDVIGTFVWALADQGTTTALKFGLWDNTGFVQGSAPLSTTSGQRTALTGLIRDFRVATPLQPNVSPERLTPRQAEPRGTYASVDWTYSGNTDAPVAHALGVPIKSQAAGDATILLRVVDSGSSLAAKDIPAASPGVYYTFETEVTAAATARTINSYITWYDSAKALISTTSANPAFATDGVGQVARMKQVALAPAGAAYASLVVKVLSAGATETHYLMRASFKALND